MISATDFEGRWQIERSIEDHLTGLNGWFEGTADFAPNGPGQLAYTEKGTLTMGSAAPMRAERRYIWTIAGDTVAVLFDDGRPFHSFDLRDGAQADHLCGDDLYCVEYRFEAWPRWRAKWSVTGPRKDYTMRSDFCRA